MREHKISERYARSIFGIAEEQKTTDEVFKDMLYIRKVLDNSKDLSVVLSSPVIKPDKKQSIVHEIFNNGVSKITLSFLSLLAKKQRIKLIENITYEYENLFNLLNNRINIDITSAIELDENVKNNIIEKINQFSKKTSIPNYKIDNKIKAGIKIQVEDWVYDATLENRMEALYKRLTKG